MQRTLELHQASLYAPSGNTVSWYKGALGEIAVAGILSMLGAGWTVLHSVPVGRGDTDIDHVVIGPPGVFTINTKSHPGQEIWIGGHGLLVSGQKTNYIGLAAAEAARAEKLLSAASGLVVPVTPVVALVSPGRRTVRAQPEGGVRVAADWELPAALSGRRIFSDEQLARIVAAAVRYDTWHTGAAAPVDTRLLSIRFNAIVARVQHGAVPAPAPAVVGAPSAAVAHPEPPLSPATSRSPRDVSPAGSARRRRGSTRRVAAAKLAAIGIGLWVFYGGVVPAFLAMLAP